MGGPVIEGGGGGVRGQRISSCSGSRRADPPSSTTIRSRFRAPSGPCRPWRAINGQASQARRAADSTGSAAGPPHHRQHRLGIASHLFRGDGGVHEDHQAGVAEIGGNPTPLPAGNRASSQPAVLIQQGDHIPDSLGVYCIGVESVAELNTIAPAPQKPKWLRACC
jgi:hypothetical protein